MVEVTLASPTPGTVPDDGWKVEYRIKGSLGAYIVPTGSPFTALPIVFTTTDPAGTLYEGNIWRDCGDLESAKFAWETPCECTTVDYVPINGTECRKTTTIPATVTDSDFCLVASTNTIYSVYGARIYNPGYTLATILLPPGSINASIFAEMTTNPQWCNPASSTTIGPLNREGVWIDSDCDGNKDPLGSGLDVVTINNGGTGYANGAYNDIPVLGGTGSGATVNVVVSGGIVTIINEVLPGSGYVVGEAISLDNALIGGGTGLDIEVGAVSGASVTIAAIYNNTGAARTVFIGVAADNNFKVVVNGNVEIDSTASLDTILFRTWHLIPVPIIVGLNYFNVIASGDGTVNDAVGMVIYDNTALQLQAAVSDASLSILFKTSTLRGTTIDVASCPSTYSLDVSEGTGNYQCVKIETKVCNTAV